METETDVVVIGLGVGGEQVAEELAAAGLKVVGVEGELVGGECPYWACIPSKMMIRAGNLLAEARRIPGMAGHASITPDWAQVADRIRTEATDDWNDQVAVDRFTDKGGRFVRGHAHLTGPSRVEVGGATFIARRGVVLATGSSPTTPPIQGLADTPYWTNRQSISTTELPTSLLVLGGGAVGIEQAQAFARFGTTVTVVEAADRLLPAEEPEVGTMLADVLTAENLTVRTSARAHQVRHRGDSFTLTLDSGEELSAQHLLVATGRRPRLDGLGLDTIGLDPQARSVPVDEQMRAAPGIWAVGDVTGDGMFTHVATYQAKIAVRNILGETGPGADYRSLPRVTFTDPEIGSVGLTEASAREQGISVRTAITQIADSTRGWIHKPGNHGLIKLVEDAGRGVLVGATSAGPAGGEVLYGLAIAVHAEIPVDRLGQMIFAYPTFHRAIEDALSRLRPPR